MKTRALSAWVVAAVAVTLVGCGGISDTPHGCNSQVPAPTIPDGGVPAGPIAATIDDVSILFPLPKNESDIPHLLSAAACGARGQLLPEGLYDSLGPIGGTTSSTPKGAVGGATHAIYSSLRVVAMRIDGCFADKAPDPHGVGCTAQVRLVLQEVTPSEPNGTTVFDSAMHLFFELSRDEFLQLAQSLVALRLANQTAGVVAGPLGPHPIMVAQGLSGPMSQGVQRLILQYAGAANLVRVAQFSQLSRVLDWSMSVSLVSDASHAVSSPFPVATVPAPDGGVQNTQNLFGAGGVGGFQATATPSTTSSDDFGPLYGEMATSLDTATAQSAFDALVRIENPAYHTVNTIDCGSCHLTTSSATLNALPLYSLDDRTSSYSFVPDGKSVTMAQMTPTQPTSGLFDLHAFSYLGEQPSIIQRTVNESAAVAEYLNQLP